MKTLTAEQVRRVKREIELTEQKLNKELRISEDLQYKNKIEEYKNHIQHLNNMIQNGWNAPTFN